MKNKQITKTETETKTETKLTLCRRTLAESWAMVWPGHIQDAAFATLTRDEIARFPGLTDFLRDRIGVIPLTLAISLSENQETTGE